MADVQRIHNADGSVVVRRAGQLFPSLLWDCRACGATTNSWWMGAAWEDLAHRGVHKCSVCGTSHRISIVVQVIAAKRGR
jgi:hypothetical protein